MKKKNSNFQKSEDFKFFFEKLSQRSFKKDICFLCARSLQEVESASEHVFPKWVQNRFNLWNQRLTLLNQTKIPYRQLIIPCCAECNKYRLQPIEIAVSQALIKGHDAVRMLGDKVLFLWLGKIFYGILFKELFLLLDRKRVNSVTITSPELIKEYKTHLLFLQQIRERLELINFSPGSIFVFRTQHIEEIKSQWDFCDNLTVMFIGIRMDDVGIIGILGDGGAQRIFEDAYKDIIDLPLHPLQFRELCAHFTYRATLSTRTPKYLIADGSPYKVYQMPLAGLSGKPLFEEWDLSECAKYLSFYTGFPIENCFQPPDNILTFLHDEYGKVNYIDFNKYPYFI